MSLGFGGLEQAVNQKFDRVDIWEGASFRQLFAGALYLGADQYQTRARTNYTWVQDCSRELAQPASHKWSCGPAKKPFSGILSPEESSRQHDQIGVSNGIYYDRDVVFGLKQQ